MDQEPSSANEDIMPQPALASQRLIGQTQAEPLDRGRNNPLGISIAVGMVVVLIAGLLWFVNTPRSNGHTRTTTAKVAPTPHGTKILAPPSRPPPRQVERQLRLC